MGRWAFDVADGAGARRWDDMTGQDAITLLGPWFAVEHHRPGRPAEPPWSSMDELLIDPGTLTGRIEHVRSALAPAGRPSDTVDLRIAASITHLGLLARLAAPVLGTAVLTGRALEVDLGDVFWQDTIGGPFPLSIPRTPPSAQDPLIGARQFLEGPVMSLTDAVARTVSVSPQILRGNIASALNGAVSMIGAARADLVVPGTRLVADLLAHPLLTGASAVVDGQFRRRSCCLIYRLADDGSTPVCQDCVLAGTGR